MAVVKADRTDTPYTYKMWTYVDENTYHLLWKVSDRVNMKPNELIRVILQDFLVTKNTDSYMNVDNLH